MLESNVELLLYQVLACHSTYVCRFLKKCVGFQAFLLLDLHWRVHPSNLYKLRTLQKSRITKGEERGGGPVSNRPSSTPTLHASRTSEGSVIQLRLSSRREPQSTVRCLDCFVAQLDEARKRDFLVAPRRLSIANVFRLLPCLYYGETSPC